VSGGLGRLLVAVEKYMRFLNQLFFVAISVAFVACSENSSDAEDSISSSVDSSSDSSSSANISGSSSSLSVGDSLSSSALFSSSSVHIDTVVTWVGNSSLKINEILPGNVSWKDDLGDDPGWVELYNSSNSPVNLEGYSLVEKTSKPRKWVFGKETVPAKGYRIVFCSKRGIATPLSGTDSDSAHYRTHTNWKLEDDGGSVYLIDSTFGIRDSANYPALATGVSWGLVGGTWKYFSTPTPEADNSASSAYSGMATVPVFGTSGGFYADPVTVTPPTAESGEEVRCTFDGSAPTAETAEMVSSITLDTNTVVRCAAFENDRITNKVITNTYFIGESVSLPVVSIAVDPYDMFDSLNGYYRQGVEYCSEPCYTANYWKDIVLPIHVEYYAKGSSSTSKAFEVDAGLSIVGGWSRYNPKKSVSISMHEEYQTGRFVYPIFATRPDDDMFRAFNLRNNGNRYYFDYIEDALGTSLLEGSGIPYQRSRQVVVFYNGKYYGIHDMREKLNEYFAETNYDADPDAVESVKQVKKEITANGGTVDGYKELLSFVSSANFSDSGSVNYSKIRTMLDVGEFADYMASEIYYHNGDWPDNNVRAYRNGSDSLWKFISFDLDHGFYFRWVVSGFDAENTNMFDWIAKGGPTGCNDDGCFAQIFNKLILNPDFKRLFINRSAVMLSYYFEPSRVTSAIDAMVATIPSSEITRDKARWNRWQEPETDGSSLKSFANARIDQVKPEYRDKFSLGEDVTLSIKSSGSGSVRVEGMILPGSTASSTNYTGTFFSGTQMQLLAVPASSASFSSWNDGNKDNPRLISLTEDAAYTATFK